ncbi:MAG: preprotein translocase subunit SecA [Coriobacteriales bacterium]|jgi:preprotein translocase subunit SecA
MANLFKKIFTIGEGKQLKEYSEIVDVVNSFEPAMEARSDEELSGLTAEFRQRYENGESLDDLLPEAFAAVREASKRTLGMRHFDVQLIGGMALHNGQIAEMKTGEGKTLVSTLAGYLNAIPGTGVHIVTVNDYLAKRDSEWMGQIYKFMKMDVGLIQNGMKFSGKRPAYEADITYGTNSEFGFDYLRDNMVTRARDRVQRGHKYAIVDEVDSILIDEARTPLIISGKGTEAAETYKKFARVMPGLQRDVDYELDEAKKTIMATEEGLKKIENMLGIDDIYSDPSGQLVNHLQQALKAEFMFHRDKDYVVMDGEVKIVDEFTGRILEGRRYSDGLHQALEAKEGVLVKEENQTLATITLQNYFRLYEKLSGMTGTAMTEDAEFRDIYHISVTAIPPNKPVIRVDKNDVVYRTLDAKFNAIVDEIIAKHEKGQPVLVGTVSIENSELLSRMLDKKGIPHQVLNAKYHEQEAKIIAQAGRSGAVTIATNMAGRGTDILLGGNPDFMVDDVLYANGIDPEEATEAEKKKALAKAKEVCAEDHEAVVKVGGLAVIGSERHASRRIDNQLRGRSGRQGDPGDTRFYLSLEDDLMRLFGGERMEKVGRMMEKTGTPDDQPLEASMVSKAIENAQHQVEALNFSSRKNVLEYDDVMNQQRQAIYEERNKILDGKDIHARSADIMRDTVEHAVEIYCESEVKGDDWDLSGLRKWLVQTTGNKDVDFTQFEEFDDANDLVDALYDYLEEIYKQKEEAIGEDQMKALETQVMLRTMDVRWMTHLQEMDYLKMGIGLRAFGQRDPLVEYKEEAHRAFGLLRDSMYDDYIRTILRIRIAVPEEEESRALRGATFSGPSEPTSTISSQNVSSSATVSKQPTSGGQYSSTVSSSGAQAVPNGKPKTYVKDKNDPFANVGRNDPCPCGSGKKFKKCHGANLGA